jgi:hypothetical protein
MTPDPYQQSAGPNDPGSWNRYAYVAGDPINRFDRNGLDFQGFEAIGVDVLITVNQSMDGSTALVGLPDDPSSLTFMAAVTLDDSSNASTQTTDDATDTVSDNGNDVTTSNSPSCPAGQVVVSNGSCDVPIYGLGGQGSQILSTAGNEAGYALGCVGIGGAVAGGTYGVSAPIIPKPFAGGGASGFTSIVRTGLGWIPLRGVQITTPIGTPGTSTFTWRGSASVGGLVGRYLPYVGLIASVYELNQCLSKQP